MHLFHEAREQLRVAMSDSAGRLLPGARVVQVGDLGGYKHGPGGCVCLELWSVGNCLSFSVGNGMAAKYSTE